MKRDGFPTVLPDETGIQFLSPIKSSNMELTVPEPPFPGDIQSDIKKKQSGIMSQSNAKNCETCDSCNKPVQDPCLRNFIKPVRNPAP